MSTSAPHRLTRAQARRVAVRAQLLTARRPTDLVAMVEHLTVLQREPTAYLAPTEHVVAWSRLGTAYDPAELEAALAEQRLLEVRQLVRAPSYLPLLRAEMADWPAEGGPARDWHAERVAWVRANDGCRREVLGALRRDAPLPTSQLPDTCEVPWRSSGWTNDRNLQQLLEMMLARGEIAMVGRQGRERLWDLAERVYPDEPVPPLAEALAERDRLRLRALGIARARSTAVPGEVNHVGGAGEAAVVEGVRGTWRVDPAYLEGLEDADALAAEERVALLSPLDRLVFDRKRMDELFDFDYTLEMYKPKEQRVWGYWALPVLSGDRLVGKLDVQADRPEGALVVHAEHRDEPWSAWTEAGVEAELASLATWSGLDLVRSPAAG